MLIDVFVAVSSSSLISLATKLSKREITDIIRWFWVVTMISFNFGKKHWRIIIKTLFHYVGWLSAKWSFQCCYIGGHQQQWFLNMIQWWYCDKKLARPAYFWSAFCNAPLWKVIFIFAPVQFSKKRSSQSKLFLPFWHKQLKTLLHCPPSGHCTDLVPHKSGWLDVAPADLTTVCRPFAREPAFCDFGFWII